MKKKECFKCKQMKALSEYLEKTHCFCKECFTKAHSKQERATRILSFESVKHHKEQKMSDIRNFNEAVRRLEENDGGNQEHLALYMESLNRWDSEFLYNPIYTLTQRKYLLDDWT